MAELKNILDNSSVIQVVKKTYKAFLSLCADSSLTRFVRIAISDLCANATVQWIGLVAGSAVITNLLISIQRDVEITIMNWIGRTALLAFSVLCLFSRASFPNEGAQ